MYVNPPAEVHIRKNLLLVKCGDCGEHTLFRCMECHRPTCTFCSFSMSAMCQVCRTAYHGSVWQLGKRADAYITSEF